MSAIRSRMIDAAGVRLHVEERGTGSPIVLLHGFTGSVRAMATIAEGLGEKHRVISIDLVGHGSSEAPRGAAAYSMTACVAQLADVLDASSLRDAHWIGYSMGGRAVLAFAVAHPERVRSAILIGAGAGIREDLLRAERARADELLAERIEREGVAAFVDYWISQPFLVNPQRLGARGVEEARNLRLANSAHGLAASLRGMGAGAQPPLFDALSRIHSPICLAVGEEDPKFRMHAEAISRELPDARVEIIPDAGHAAHTDNPRRFLALANRFFAEVESRTEATHSATSAAPQTHMRTP